MGCRSFIIILLQVQISDLPNLLQFLSFVYFFPAFLGGPAFEYKRYSDFIENKYSHETTVIVDKKKKTTIVQKKFATSAPASWLPVLRCFFIGQSFLPFRLCYNLDFSSPCFTPRYMHITYDTTTLSHTLLGLLCGAITMLAADRCKVYPLPCPSVHLPSFEPLFWFEAAISRFFH